ncbi:MAG: hypothetical protein A3C71_00975 [Candidatus Yanofskybacteria bacterium RIFCSPHIGHO2_02_FULL_43_15c]|uniref:Apolipoprotein N-acyltransferase n=2 Tax=Candidatus Yanofskyibacteriota TaxID=1752733 RepID=A0A1F8H4Y9_9BACT|nr:MAG: hypothetical protein A3C71_00975 [Candidatus Yanofskybacteria bacterium RIFCSPHIGHO2_02_FULL_43_15c]OGN32672.1 MAG: hypothetical protein A3I92_02940 [Candidatus Yanofskybacteria bacterium RIFCSPLOWO2_02_FULL_43_10b]
MGKNYQSILAGTIIGLTLSLSQPFYGWWFLVFLGLVLVFLATKLFSKGSGAFSLGYLVGLVYFLIDFKWLWAVYPLTNLGIENKILAFFFIFLTWVITAGAMAFAWGSAVWLFHQTDRRVSYSALLIFPSVFTLSEYVRSFFIALVWTGHQTPIGPFWTLGNLAYNFHGSFLFLKFASWFGIYGVVFLTVFLSVWLFVFLEKRRYKKLLFLVLGIFIFFYWPNFLRFDLFEDPRSNLNQKIEVAIIQTKTPSKPSYTSAEEVSIFKTQLELIDSIGKNSPQAKLIIFPEESNFFTRLAIFKKAPEASRYFADLFAKPVLILDNSQISEKGQFKARTIFLDSQKGILGSYDKYLITPGAEYVPLLFKKLDKTLGLNSPELQNIAEYQTGGERPPVINSEEGIRIMALVCADIFSPNLTKLGAAQPNLLVSQSSFAFGHGPKDLLAKDLAASKLRAAESGRYLIKSSNFGYSFVVSDTGKQIKTTSNFDPQILTASVVLKDGKTLYNKVGDAPILLASFAVLLVSLFWKSEVAKAQPF